MPAPRGLPPIREKVGVRELGEGAQKLTAEALVPEPVDAPPPGGGHPVPVAPRQIPQPGPAQLISTLVKEIPAKWTPTEEDLAFLQRDVNIGQAKVAKGVPLSESIRRMMAEESAARAFAGAEDTFEFPWWILALPLIREAYTVLKQSPYGPKARPVGYKGPAGPGGHGEVRLNPADRKLADAIQRSRTRVPAAGAKPAPVRAGGPAGGGKHIDARTLMQNVTNVGRRQVRRNRTQDPTL